MIEMSFELRGLNRVKASLNRVKTQLDPSKVIFALANQQKINVTEGTLSGTDIEGRLFHPLAFGRGGTPLVDTGRMIASVVPIRISDNTSIVAISSGPELKKGLIHQRGVDQPIKPLRAKALKLPIAAYSSSLKTKKVSKKTTNLFFKFTRGIPKREWFGFRPPDKKKLLDLASLIVKSETMKFNEGR